MQGLSPDEIEGSASTVEPRGPMDRSNREIYRDDTGRPYLVGRNRRKPHYLPPEVLPIVIGPDGQLPIVIGPDEQLPYERGDTAS